MVTRTVFDYGKADWASIRRDLDAFDWTYIDRASVDNAEQYLHDNLFHILGLYIQRRILHERQSAHPWVNERCLEAIRSKNATAGTDEFALASTVCSGILFEEYLAYIERMRDKLRKEKRGSKGWWRDVQKPLLFMCKAEQHQPRR